MRRGRGKIFDDNFFLAEDENGDFDAFGKRLVFRFSGPCIIYPLDRLVLDDYRFNPGYANPYEYKLQSREGEVVCRSDITETKEDTAKIVVTMAAY